MVRFAAAAIALAATVLGYPANGSEIELLDFWSPSCGPCMQMKPTIEGLESAGYPIRQVDASREPQLARQYNVDRVPCFVMLVRDREVERVVGFTSSERLQQMFGHAKEVLRRQIADGVRAQSPDGLQAVQPVGQPPGVAPGPTQQDADPRRPQRNPWTGVGDDPARSPAVDSPSNLLAATVRLRVDDSSGHSYGTGTIIDARSGDALVVSCGHLFRESKGQGPVTVELFEATADGVRAVAQMPGEMINYDLDRDVALISIRPNRPVTVAPLAPRRTVIERGDRVVSVGCSNGQDPTVLSTRVTQLDRYQGPPNIETSGAPVEGRSGGGLFNAQGQLIGVCFAADYEGNEGLYAALESIYGALDPLQLDTIGVAAAGAGQARDALAGREAAALEPIVRGQEPLAPVMPIPDRGPSAQSAVVVNPTKPSAAAPASLNTVEQAAWEEIMSRAANAEVICIIRPKEPGGQSEVITLENVSPEFARALAGRHRDPQAPLAR